MKGLVHIYTGNGKGKTTAAIGLGIRACGRDFRVLMVQFLKSGITGEMATLKKLEPGFRLYRGTKSKKFTWNMNEEELAVLKKEQQNIFQYAMDAVDREECDLLILDEIIGALGKGFLQTEDVIHFIKNKPEHLEVVMTGRNPPSELIESADYVSEIREVKHPFSKGISARKGIES